MAGPLMEHEAGRRTMGEASDIIGADLALIGTDAGADELAQTAICQPLVLACSVAAWRIEHTASSGGALGHSLGEYAALVSCGVLSFADAIGLVRIRAELTSALAARRPGGMSAILGADLDQIAELCAGVGGVWPANVNCPGQVVVSGLTEPLAGVEAAAIGRGWRARRLAVEGAFHCPLMEDCLDDFRAAVARVSFTAPQRTFVSATSGRVESDPTRLAELLVTQLVAPVLFQDAIRAARGAGFDNGVEFSPRTTLQGLVRRIDPGMSVRCTYPSVRVAFSLM